MTLLFTIVLDAQQAFHYNRPYGLDPLTVGMKNDQPIAIDWDEDRRIDLITGGESGWVYFFSRTALR